MYRLTNFTTNIRGQLLIETYKHWLNKNENVLDVGCGDGIMSSIIINKLGIKLTGCDIANYLQIKIPFALMTDETSLPFKKNSFDVVMLNDVLHHMSFENQEKIITECLRVAPKVILFEDEPTIIGSLTDYIINKFHNINMEVPLTFRSPHDWRVLFGSIGATSVYKKTRKPFLYPFTHESFLVRKPHKNSI
jgi:ubiquinone/menaquinone biosynthesis C-methylase UbiE